MRERTRGLAVLVAIAALGGVLRWGVLETLGPPRFTGDENYYGITAINLASGRGHINSRGDGGSRAWRPPAHAWVLSWFVDPDQPRSESNLKQWIHRMLLWQVALGTLLVFVTGCLGRALFDWRVAWGAAAVMAVYPNWVAQSHTLWSEPLFAVLVTGALATVVGLQQRRGWGPTVLAGVLFGAAALTREAAIPIAAVSSFWLWHTAAATQQGRAARRAVLMLGLMVAAIVPWTLRNQRVLGRFVPVSTVGWFAAAEGNTLESSWLAPDGPALQEYRTAYFAIADEGERLDYARHHALQRIAAEQPLWIFKKILRSLAQLGEPDSVLLFKLRRGNYGDVTPAWRTALLWLCALSYGGVLATGVVGMASAPGSGRRLLPVLVLAAIAGLHIFANATPRFRLPWMPLFMVYGAWSVLHWRSLPSALSGRRWIAPAAALGFLVAVCIPYFAVYGGRH